MVNLESKAEPVDYKISDFFVPFKALRHIPEIVQYEDNFTKYFELGFNLILVAANLTMYGSLYQWISK